MNSRANCKPISIRDDFFFYELLDIKWFEASYFHEEALFTSMLLHVLQAYGKDFFPVIYTTFYTNVHLSRTLLGPKRSKELFLVIQIHIY